MRITKKQGGIIGGIAAAVIIGTAVGVHTYYQDRWYPGSTFNKVDVSGMKYEESIEKVKKSIASYKLKIKGRDKGQDTITGQDIDLAFTSEEKVKNAYHTQHNQSVITSFFSGKNRTNVTAVTFSEKKLQNLLKKSVLTTGSKEYSIVKPKDATIVYSEEKQYGVIQKEVEGNLLNTKVFETVAGQAVESLKGTLNLKDQKAYPDVYQKPGLYENDKELEEMQKTYNNYLLHWIQWDMGNNVKETLGPETLKDCIKVNTKKHTVKISQSSVEKWLEDFCLKYKTQGIVRTFKTHSGKKIKVSGGDYGWRIDYDKVISQTMKILKKAPTESDVKAYQKKPNEENQKALLTALKPVYSHKGYRMNYNKKENDWDTQNYSEVDLTEQMVYVYKKGKLVFSTNCITGKATPDRITRTGVYDIKEKKLTKTLTGADYSVPTRYWTRIMWTGTGYHYSSRGDWGSWSPTYYKTAGSHGCINLTLSDAEAVYRLTEIGDPCFIHY